MKGPKVSSCMAPSTVTSSSHCMSVTTHFFLGSNFPRVKASQPVGVKLAKPSEKATSFMENPPSTDWLSETGSRGSPLRSWNPTFIQSVMSVYQPGRMRMRKRWR